MSGRDESPRCLQHHEPSATQTQAFVREHEACNTESATKIVAQD